MNQEIDNLFKQIEAKMAPAEVVSTTLPMKIKKFHKVDSHKLEAWLAERLGLSSFEIVDSDNHSDYEVRAYVRANGIIWWDEDEIKLTMDYISKRRHVSVHKLDNVLSHFAELGDIPAGDYIINVSW